MLTRSMNAGRMLGEVRNQANNFFFICVLAFAYTVCGYALALPYIWLAGWDTHAFVVAATWSPIILVVGGGVALNLGAAFLSGRCASRSMLGQMLRNRVFLAFLGYLALPIAFNGISIGLQSIGLTSAAETIFSARYLSLALAAPVALLGYLLFLSVRNGYLRLTGRVPPGDEYEAD